MINVLLNSFSFLSRFDIDWAEVWYVTVQLLNGFKLTLGLFFLTLIFSLPLGLVFSFGTMSKIKPLRYLVKGFVYIIRGTPLLLQLMIILPGATTSGLQMHSAVGPRPE